MSAVVRRCRKVKNKGQIVKMNKLSKTILRSTLRWRHKHDRKAPCLLQLRDESNGGVIKKYLPEGAVLSTPDKIRAAALYLARTVDFPSAVEASAFHTEAFDLLRRLDDIGILMEEERKGREYRSQALVLKDATIRVGQAVRHKTGGYRGVCFAWTMQQQEDSTVTIDRSTGNKTIKTIKSNKEKNRQIVSLLLDWYDYEEILHSTLPPYFYASDFEVISDDTLQRIHHNDLSMYFDRYDVKQGVYIPNRSLQYQYPMDLAYTMSNISQSPSSSSGGSSRGGSSSSSSSRGSSIAHNAIGASRNILNFSEYLIENLSHILVTRGVVRPSTLNMQDTRTKMEVTCEEDKELLDRGEIVLEDILFTLKAMKQTLLPLSASLLLKGTCARDLTSGITSSSSSSSNCSNRIVELHSELLSFEKDVSNGENQLNEIEQQHQKLQMQAHALLKHIFRLFLSVEQLLIHRYQCVGGASYFLSQAPSTECFSDDSLSSVNTTHNTTSFNESSQTSCSSNSSSSSRCRCMDKLPTDHKHPKVDFSVGQVLRHKQFHYRGVCAGYDIRPSVDTSQWEGLRYSDIGTEQPYYRVSETTIVSE